VNNSKVGQRKIPARQLAIGVRLKEARKFLGLSQKEFADGVGIKRVRLASYEGGYVPLKCEIALRACRRWSIDECWLATGREFKGQSGPSYRFGDAFRASIFLPGEPVLDKLRPGMLFSEAYDSVLRLEYWKLLGASARIYTRFDFSERADPEELRASMHGGMAKWLLLLPAEMRRRFCICMMKCGAVLFSEFPSGRNPATNVPPTAMEKAIDKAWGEAGLNYDAQTGQAPGSRKDKR
jgi:transcriptional regulator with XRE-family HTH domain